MHGRNVDPIVMPLLTTSYLTTSSKKNNIQKVRSVCSASIQISTPRMSNAVLLRSGTATQALYSLLAWQRYSFSEINILSLGFLRKSLP
jgi:hypothetical protein